jgi:hypothetical protein
VRSAAGSGPRLEALPRRMLSLNSGVMLAVETILSV